jgi:DNA-binding CsgD family transcriptional regulator
VAATAGVDGPTTHYSGLWDILGPFTSSFDQLEVSHRRALGTAFALEEPDPSVSEPLVAVSATTLLTRLAAERPVVVLVDDLPWLDPPSRTALIHAAAVGPPGVAFVLTSRDGVDRGLANRAAITLELGPLDVGAALDVLTEGSGVAVARSVAERLTRDTGGNPLALRELARLLDADQLQARAAIRDPVPVVGALERYYRDRLERLPERTRLALLVAAAEPSGRRGPIGRAIVALGGDLDDLHPAEAAGLVRLSFQDVRFAHPLQRAAAYQAAPPRTRHLAHEALAAAHADDDTTAEVRAWHRIAATDHDDEATARLAEDAALLAARGAAHASAARLYRAAADVSPDPARRASRLCRGVRSLFAVGDMAAARDWLQEARLLGGPPELRAELDVTGALLELWGGRPRTAYALLADAAELTVSSDRARSAWLLARAVAPLVLAGDIVRARAVVDAAAARAGRAPQARDITLVLALATVAVLSGDVASARTELARIDVPPGDAARLQAAESCIAAAILHVHLCDFDAAHRLLDPVIATARRWTALGTLPFACAAAAQLAWWEGRWMDAQAHVGESVELASSIGALTAGRAALLVGAYIDAACGDYARAASRLDDADRWGDPEQSVLLAHYRGGALGLAELTAGHAEAAVARFTEVAHLAVRSGLELPTVVPWEADMVEALVRAGRRDEARDRLDQLTERTDRCGLDWAAGVTARARALLSADDEEAAGLLADALTQFGPTRYRFDRGRTALVLGDTLARLGRTPEAHRCWASAASAFKELRARPWLRRAIDAEGSRDTSALDTLTRQERAVVDAIVQGMSNSEVAAHLYVSPKTVESHLSRIYRKLGLRSRTQLVSFIHTHRRPDA